MWRSGIYRLLLQRRTALGGQCTAKLADRAEPDADEAREVIVKEEVFDSIPKESRNKEAFTKALGLFRRLNTRRVGYTEFIYAALKRMKDFGVHKDLDVYKCLLELFPKGQLIPKNFIQVEGMHYPKQQQCCIDVLDEMEWNRVYPDKELYMIVKNAFGEWTHAMRKMKRMMYWMPKFKNADPYPMQRPLPQNAVDLAKLVMSRMSRDPAHHLDVYRTDAIPEAVEKTWLVSSQSPLQRDLLQSHPAEESVFVNGPYRVWLMDNQFHYFTLASECARNKRFDDFAPQDPSTDAEWTNWKTKYNSEESDYQVQLSRVPSIHEQPDATILAMVIAGNSSKESLACWIKFLEKANPALAQIPVVFRVRSYASPDALPTQQETEHLRQPLIKH